jgi:hypothetical protein
MATSSSIIKDIESIRATGLASVAYYYFDFKDARKQDRRGLLSSLLTLDESPTKPGTPSPREKVLRFMKELVDLRYPDIRVCITSRPEVDIRMVLEPLASHEDSHSVSLHDEGGQRNDIINYIKSVVGSDANMRKWRAEDRQLVIDSVSQKANGM